MTPMLQPTPTVLPPTPLPYPDDAWRIGIRYQRVEQPDGEVTYKQVPLTEEDLLYPQEEDHVSVTHEHVREFHYCYGALTSYYQEREGFLVLGDHLVDYDVAGVQPLAADITVLEGVTHWRQEATFRQAIEGGRILLHMEFTSPSTRRTDIGEKVALYYRARALYYVIADRGADGKQPVRLLVRRRGPADWLLVPAGSDGRYDLEPLGLLVGVDEGWVRFWDKKTGKPLLDLSESYARTAEVEAKALKEAEARADAEAKAKDAETKAKDAETKAKHAETKAKHAETKAKHAETKAKHAETKAKDAEAKAKDAEAKAKDAEAKAKDAEAKAKDEAKARADAEAKAKDAAALAQKEARARAEAEAKARNEARARAEAEAKAKEQDERIRRLEAALRRATLPPDEVSGGG